MANTFSGTESSNRNLPLITPLPSLGDNEDDQPITEAIVIDASPSTNTTSMPPSSINTRSAATAATTTKTASSINKTSTAIATSNISNPATTKLASRGKKRNNNDGENNQGEFFNFKNTIQNLKNEIKMLKEQLNVAHSANFINSFTNTNNSKSTNDNVSFLSNNSYAPLIEMIEEDEEPQLHSEQSQINEIYANNENDDGFEVVKRKIKNKNVTTKPKTAPSITISNNTTVKKNFSLNEANNNNNSKPSTSATPSTEANKSTAATTTAAITKKQRRPPPIHIFEQDVKSTVALAKGLKIQNFEVKRINANKHSITTDSLQNYTALKTTFDEVDTKFYTYTPKELKPKSLVLRGLTETENLTEMKTDIETMDEKIDIIKIIQMRSKRNDQNKRLLPLYIVQFSPSTPLNAVYAIRHINYQKVVWQTLNRNDDILQCKNCQRYGHTATNCNLEFRCVKCSNTHEPGDCTVTEEVTKENIFCINCKKAGHPASYKGCPIYQTMILRLRKRIADKRAQQEITKATPKMFDSIKVSKANGTFAQMMQGGPTVTLTTTTTAAPPAATIQQQTNTDLQIKTLTERMDNLAVVMQKQGEQLAQLLQFFAQL